MCPYTLQPVTGGVDHGHVVGGAAPIPANEQRAISLRSIRHLCGIESRCRKLTNRPSHGAWRSGTKRSRTTGGMGESPTPRSRAAFFAAPSRVRRRPRLPSGVSEVCRGCRGGEVFAGAVGTPSSLEHLSRAASRGFRAERSLTSSSRIDHDRGDPDAPRLRAAGAVVLSTPMPAPTVRRRRATRGLPLSPTVAAMPVVRWRPPAPIADTGAPGHLR
jgi:hypothetical protein